MLHIVLSLLILKLIIKQKDSLFSIPIFDCFRVNKCSLSTFEGLGGELIGVVVSCRSVLDELAVSFSLSLSWWYALTNWVDSSSWSVSSPTIFCRLSFVVIIFFYFFFKSLFSCNWSSSLSIDIFIVGICRSICGRGGLVGKPCFRRRENLKACRTLLHVATDGEPLKK